MSCRRCGGETPAGARFCPHCGASLAPDTEAEGERRHATIVFSDLSGYTALNERLDPEEVEDIMGRVKRLALEVFERHGGVVNQFIGDEIVALFGIPVARRDDAVRAVRAALELHARIRELSVEFARRGGAGLCLHTGLQSGLVIARRSDARSGHYQLTGDTVNTAARILKLAGDDEIVAGQGTWQETGGRFEAEALVPTAVKGKEKPVTGWRILQEREDEARPGNALVGRGAELALVDALARNCLSGAGGGVVILRGDPGIGKSRLSAEFRSRAEELGFAVHQGFVLDLGGSGGREAVQAVCRSLAAGAPSVARDPERDIFRHELLDLPVPDVLQPIAAALDEATRKRGTLREVRDLARNAAAGAPQFVLVEDIHWAEAWPLEHLRALASAAEEGPLLLVMTARREGPEGLLAGWTPEARVLELAALEAADALQLALNYAAVPLEAARDFVARAEGNPLFLEQMLLNAGEAAKEGMPGSIQALVLARLDRLPAPLRGALQAAAVLGQHFSLEAVGHLLGGPVPALDLPLENRLIRTQGGGGFLFTHALIREGIYASLLKARRRELHRRAAAWFGARDLALAAEHLELAQDPAAPHAYLAASQEEARRFRFDRALDLVQRGLALAESRDDRLALFADLARLQLDLGRAVESLAAWQEAMALDPDPALRCRALIGMAAAMRLIDRAEEGLAALAEAEPLTLLEGLEQERSRLHHLRGNLYFGLGRSDDCLREHEAALVQARRAGSAEAEANALSGLGDAHYIRGRMMSANREFGRCVALAREHGLTRIEVANLHMRGWTTHHQGRLQEALDTGLESIALARRVSHGRVELIARSLAAFIGGWLLGEAAPARAHLAAAGALAVALGARRFEGQVRAYEALLEFRFGDRAAAHGKALDTLAFCREHGMAFFGPVVLGMAARFSQDAAEARRLNDEAEQRLEAGAISHNHFEYRALAIDGAIERGEWQDAIRQCAALRRYMADEPSPFYEFVARRGEALAALGSGAGAPDLPARIRALADEAEGKGVHGMGLGLRDALARLESR